MAKIPTQHELSRKIIMILYENRELFPLAQLIYDTCDIEEARLQMFAYKFTTITALNELIRLSLGMAAILVDFAEYIWDEEAENKLIQTCLQAYLKRNLTAAESSKWNKLTSNQK